MSPYDYKPNDFCVAKRDAYIMKLNDDGLWVEDQERRILTEGKQYLIIGVTHRSIKVINDESQESSWTFKNMGLHDERYSFPFYTKEELRENRLNTLLKKLT